MIIWYRSHLLREPETAITIDWWFFTNPSEKYAQVKGGSFPRMEVNIKKKHGNHDLLLMVQKSGDHQLISYLTIYKVSYMLGG